MHKKALLACLLVVTMLLTGCSLIEKDMAVDAATEVIRVGDTMYTKGEVLDHLAYQLNYMAFVYQMYGMNFDINNPDLIADTREEVISLLVEDAVMNIKVKELGLDQLTAEEQTELDEKIETAWQSNLDNVKVTYFADTELTGDELTAALEAKCLEQGILKENVAEGQRVAYTQNKLRSYVTDPIEVTEEELVAAFDAKVTAAQESYANNLSAFGSNMNNGLTVYYRPAGYRMVKQILVKFHEDDQAVIDDLNKKISTQTTAVNTLSSNLSNLGATETSALLEQVNVTIEQPAVVASATDLVVDANVTDVTAAFGEETTEDVAEAAKQLAEAKAVLAFYEAQLATAKELAFAAIDAETDDILAQLADGADWDTLMAEKTQDPGMQGDRATAKTGYAVCENFSGFDAAFTSAAMALENVGDISAKTAGAYGYYIIQYTSDVEEGSVALDDVRESLTASTLSTKQETAYADALAQWVNEADVKIDRKALED